MLCTQQAICTLEEALHICIASEVSVPSRDETENNQHSLCPYPVSFHQLGWEHWTTALPRCPPSHCMGTCPGVPLYGLIPQSCHHQNHVNKVVNQSISQLPVSLISILAHMVFLLRQMGVFCTTNRKICLHSPAYIAVNKDTAHSGFSRNWKEV